MQNKNINKRAQSMPFDRELTPALSLESTSENHKLENVCYRNTRVYSIKNYKLVCITLVYDIL